MSSSPSRQQQSYAFVTLLSSPEYLPGALVLAASLRSLHPKSSSPIPYKLVCLVTPETVDAGTIGKLREAWDLVVGVEVLEHENQSDGLKLLGRPDLHSVLTKLHVFRLTPFTKVIFLDADVLPLKPLSHLFAIPNVFSAAPDTGWPDCFNSGVMVLEPSQGTFDGLMKMMSEGEGTGGDGTFDGGDQGILNQYFNGEDGRPEWNRISFTYNTTPTAAYTYAPAYKHYGPKIHAVHFIGAQKPWSSLSYRSARPPPSGSLPYDYNSLIDRWFGVYDKFVRPTYALRSFEVPRTVAAWEGGSTGGRLGLEELKKIAEEGWWRGTGPNGAPEGAYMALPRDGRIDLMRRNPEAEPIPSPSSPPPLPSQQERSAPSPVIQSPEPVRPHDQYLTNWDPARSSPPRGSGPEHHQMREPMDARYENVWDLQETRAQKENDRRWREGGGGRQIWDVPSEMRDGRYNITTEQWKPSSLSTSVFPWESRHRKTPSRVFPRGDTPPPLPPSLPQIVEPTPHPVAQDPAPPFPPQPSPYSAPPPRSFDEAMRGYTNAWDADPRIARYVTRLSGGDNPAPRAAAPAQVGGADEENPNAGANGSGGRGRRDDRAVEGRRSRVERSRDGGEEGDDEEEDESGGSIEGVPVPKRDNRGGGPGGGASGGGGSSNPSLGTARPSSGRSPRRAAASLPSDQQRSTQTSRTHSQQSSISISSRAIQTSPPRVSDVAVQVSPEPSQTGNSSATPSPFPNSSPTAAHQDPQQAGPPSYPTSEIPPSLPHSPSTHPHHHRSGSTHQNRQQTSPSLLSPAGEGLLGLKRYSFGEGAESAAEAPQQYHQKQQHSREQSGTSGSGTSTAAESAVATPQAGKGGRSPETSVYAEASRDVGGGEMEVHGASVRSVGRSWDPARNVEQLKDKTLNTLERYMREAEQERH